MTPSFLPFTPVGGAVVFSGPPSLLGQALTLRMAVSQGENGPPVSCQRCPAEGWGEAQSRPLSTAASVRQRPWDREPGAWKTFLGHHPSYHPKSLLTLE